MEKVVDCLWMLCIICGKHLIIVDNVAFFVGISSIAARVPKDLQRIHLHFSFQPEVVSRRLQLMASSRPTSRVSGEKKWEGCPSEVRKTTDRLRSRWSQLVAPELRGA